MTTTPTIPKRGSSELPTPAAPEREVHVEVISNAASISPRDIFDIPEVADRMRLCSLQIVLDPADQEAIKQVWETKRDGYFFPWSLNGFLKYLVPYFSSRTIKGTIELVNGTLFAVGKPFWAKTLGKVVDQNAVTPEILNFCETPRCFELWITLPASLEREWGRGTPDQLNRFRDIVVYLFAVQALDDPPSNYVAALHEFNALMGGEVPEDEEKVKRLTALRESFQAVSRYVSVNDIARSRLAIIEILCGQDHSFKVTFGFSPPEPDCFRCNDFKLELFSDLEAALRCPPHPWECLHQQLVQRLIATTTHPSLGRYWAQLTQGGPPLISNELRDFLRESQEPPAYAFTAGMRYLPPGEEAIVAYHANAVSFLDGAEADMQLDISKGSVFTPMGDILSSHDVVLASSVLKVIGTLQACFKITLPGVPQCRQREIVWKANTFLHLVLPSDFEWALAKAAGWFKHDPDRVLNCLSDCILALFPIFSDIPQTPFQPRFDQRIDMLYFALRANSAYSEAALRLYFLLHGTGWKTIQQSDVIDLPNFIGYAVATDQLDLMLQSLERIYRGSRYDSLFIEVRSRIKEPACTDSRQACIHELLVCRDIEVLKLTWKFFRDELGVPFLLGIAPSVPDEALPFALNRVCYLCRSLPFSDSYKLLTVYLNRLIQQGGGICASYKPKLLELLNPLLVDPTLQLQLLSNRLISQEVPAQPASLLSCLRAAMVEPSVWWGHFQTVRQLLPKDELHQELAGVFQTAIRKWDLTAQDGYGEVYQTVMAGVSDIKTRLSIFINGGRCEESDVMDLPDYIVHGIETGQFESVLESLGRAYAGTRFAPLFAAVGRAVVASPDECRQVCTEQFLLQGETVLASQRPRLIELLQQKISSDPIYRLRVLSNPALLAQVVISENLLLESLIETAGRSELAVWWGHFQLVHRLLQERGTYGVHLNQLAKIFMSVHRKTPLTALAGYAETSNSLAEGVSEPNLRFAFFIYGTRCEEADVMALPDFICYGVETGQLRPALKSLERVYQGTRFAHLFGAIRSEIAALESPSSSACRQICTEQFRVCEEPKILAAAWANSEDVQVSFLRDIALRLGPNALPFAASRVCTIQTDRFRLFCLYIDRLLSAQLPAAELIALLKPLLEDPELRLQLLSHPRVMAAIPVTEASLVENLRTVIGKADPTDWWNQFLILRTSQGSAMEGVFQDALRHSPGAVNNREGFAEIFNGIAKRLFDQRDDAQLISFLRLLPVGKTDKLVHPWFRALIERNIQEKRPVGEWTETLAALRGTKAHLSVDRAVVLNLLTYLIESKTVGEVHHLCPLLEPAELRPALDYFMEYYASGLTDGILINEMRKTVGYFSAAKDPRIAPLIHAVASRLKKDDPLWTNFADLYGLMVNNSELFLEDSVQLLERLAANPPLQCFRTPIREIGQRFKREQKFRVARAYAVAFGHLPVDELLGALPNGHWLIDLLRRDESWEEFTRIFLHVARGTFDVKLLPYAVWAAPHVLAHPDSPLFAGFERYCVGIPTHHLDTPEWRPIVTRLVDRNPVLLNQTDRAKAKLFKQCQTKVEAPKPPVVKKEETAAPPNPVVVVVDTQAKIRSKIRELLANKPVTIKRLLLVVEELAKLPEEYRLWQEFFKALPDKKVFETNRSGIDLLNRAWQVWLETHPPKDFTSEHGMEWVGAVRSLLCMATATSDLWITFLVNDTTGLLVKMDVEASKQLTGICLELAVLYGWNEPNRRTNEMIAAIHRILANELLQKKFEHPDKMLSQPYQTRLFLVFAQHPDEAVQQAGESWVTGVISAVRLMQSLGSEGNLILFKLFCIRPFIPRGPGNQQFYMKWLEDCWELFKQQLTWGEACDCLKTVIQLEFDQADQSANSQHIRIMHQMWESLVIGAQLEKWQGVAAIERGAVLSNSRLLPMIVVHPGAPNRFSDPTVMLIDRTVRGIGSPKEKAELLLSLRRVFYKLGNAFTSEQTRNRFQLRFCTRVLPLAASGLPETNEVVCAALDDLNVCLSEFAKEETSEQQECTKVFIMALPALFKIDRADLMPKIAMAIHNMMKVGWVAGCTLDNKSIWHQLLFILADAARDVNFERRGAVAALFVSVRELFYSNNFPREAAYQFQFHFSRVILSLVHFDPIAMAPAVCRALDEFSLSLGSFKEETPERQESIQKFIAAIPLLMNMTEPDLMPKIRMAIEQAIDIRWVLEATNVAPHSWFQLLTEVTEGLLIAKPVRKRAVAEAAYQIFMSCMHPSLVILRNSDVPHELLLSKSTLVFTFIFMTRISPDCLTDDEWENLVHAIYFNVLKKTIDDLLRRKTTGRVPFLSSQAAARLIRYSKSFDPQLVAVCLEAASLLPPMVEDVEDLVQLECRVQWVLAMSALIKRCHKPPLELLKCKMVMTGQLVQLGFECMNEANYAEIIDPILRVMNNDPHVTEGILTVLPKVLEADPSSFCDSMAVARIIRCSNVADPRLVQLCMTGVRCNIPPITNNAESIIQAECRAQWIMAMSALEKRSAERPQALTQQKIVLTKDLTWFCMANAQGEASSKFVFKLLMEIMLNDLDIAEAVNSVLSASANVGAMTPLIALLKSQTEKTIERLRKQ